MTNDPLTDNRVSSVRYELLHVTNREVYGWVDVPTVLPFEISESFEDTEYDIDWSDNGSGSAARSNSVAGHTGSWFLAINGPGSSATHDVDVTVPEGSTEMTFWYRRVFATPQLRVYLDDVLEFEDTVLDTTWDDETIDVTGVSVVTFRAVTFGESTNTLGLDDIEFSGEAEVQVPTWTLLDIVQEEGSGGDLDGVNGGSLDFVANASIKGGGSITIVDNGQAIDFLNDRIKIYYTVEGYGETALGVYLFSEAPETWSGTGRTWEVKLLDKNAIFDQDAVGETTLVDSGTVATDQVATYLAGENQALTPSTATLAGPQTFEAGTSYLSIINDLLATIGYFSMTPNGDGQFVIKPYVLPANRPIIWEFLDGENCIYIPDFTNDVDLFSIPNTFIAVGQGDGTTAALTSTYTNTDPASPYSTVSRGRTISAVEVGIEAADQTTLDDYAQRRLVELTSPTQSIEIQHAYVPGLAVNDAVWFRSVPADINARHVVTKTVVELDPTALCTTTLQKVVAL